MTNYEMEIIEIEYDLAERFNGIAVKLPEEEKIYITLSDGLKKNKESIFNQVKESFLNGNYMYIEGNLVIAF